GRAGGPAGRRRRHEDVPRPGRVLFPAEARAAVFAALVVRTPAAVAAELRRRGFLRRESRHAPRLDARYERHAGAVPQPPAGTRPGELQLSLEVVPQPVLRRRPDLWR